MAGVTAFSWYKTRPSAGPMVIGYPEAAAQSATLKGDPVKLDTAGRVLLAVDTEGSSTPDRAGFFGFAAQDMSGTTDAIARVLIPTPLDLFAVSASAAGATRTVTRSDVGLRCSWIRSTVTDETTKSVLDTSDTTAAQLHFEIIDTLDAVGVVDGRYLARVSSVAWGIARAT
ncbi:hypothetical protein LCGC14_2231270 [marine sediment metagenome]|uniref:Uncharacterized protein n=1 Tax=marine sediment metagenome TaxID=412755 RepID=A0A0F9D8G3_9ZZZZ